MGFCCFYKNECCFGCYTRLFTVRRFFRRNKTAPDDFPKSPSPSIALTAAGSLVDEQSIQDQLSLFHFGSQNTSGRRFSHPNQIKYVEEYERQRGLSQPGSPCSSIHPGIDEFDYDEVHTGQYRKEVEGNKDDDLESGRKTPTSPVMQEPVVPPGRLIA